jgi:hypothetical protein
MSGRVQRNKVRISGIVLSVIAISGVASSSANALPFGDYLLASTIVLGQENSSFSHDVLESNRDEYVMPKRDLPLHNGNLPEEIFRLVYEVYSSADVSSFVWDDKTKSLSIWLEPTGEIGFVEGLIENSGYTVIVDRVQFSREEISNAISTLISAGTVAGMEISWIAPTSDRSALLISPSSPPRMRVGSGLGFLSGIPLELTEYSSPQATARDRNLHPPFHGGQLILRPGIAFCSSAFSVVNIRNGQTGLLTADHCGRTADHERRWFGASRSLEDGSLIGFQPQFLPHIWENQWPRVTDSMVITGAPVRAGMWWGPHNGTNLAPVDGTAPVVIGSLVAMNGQPTGTVFQNEITHTGLAVVYDWDLAYRDLVRSVQISGIPAAGSGDSGGPVFSVNSIGGAMAVGVISGISNPSNNCTGMPATNTRQCGTIVFFSPIGASLAGTDYQVLRW